MNKNIINWLRELRAPFLTASIVSVFFGTAISWSKNNIFSPVIFLETLIGIIFLHLGTNIINDYFDYKSGNDKINTEYVRPFSGGSRIIQLGYLSPQAILIGALIFYTLGASIGVHLAYTRGLFIILLSIIGLISGVFYIFPRFNFVRIGFGEILVGVNFGTLITLGSYYTQTQQIIWEPIIASIPISLLICSVLFINEFPDYNADKLTGKNTLVVRLGRSRAIYLYVLMVTMAYLVLLLNILVGLTPLYTIFALIPFPLSIKAIKLALKFHSKPNKLAPGNALTIIFHLITSLLLSVGYIINRLEITSLNFIYVLIILLIPSLFTFLFYKKNKT